MIYLGGGSLDRSHLVGLNDPGDHRFLGYNGYTLQAIATCCTLMRTNAAILSALEA